MRDLGYFIKMLLFQFSTLFENVYYSARFWYYVSKGRFNKDYNSTQEKEGYHLTFIDDFDKPEIDWNIWDKWNATDGDVHPPKSICKPSIDCLIWDGDTKLTLKTDKNDDPEFPEFPLKCGSLVSSYNKWWCDYTEYEKGFEQMFGYFEINCKPPAQGKLFWPSFWMWEHTWPPEIDIFEFMDEKDIGHDYTKGISFSTHYGYSNKNPESKYFKSQHTKGFRQFLGLYIDHSKHFHNYACKWDPQYVKFYIDDVCVYKQIYNIPTTPMAILIGISAWYENPPKDSDLPGEFVVDYVRVYQKNEEN